MRAAVVWSELLSMRDAGNQPDPNMKTATNMKTRFTKTRALREYTENRNRWTGGAVIVHLGGNEYQAIPGAYLSDVSYTGSRTVIDPAGLRRAR